MDVELLVPYNRIAKRKRLKVEMEGNTLDELIAVLTSRIPALEHHLMDEEVPGAVPFLLLINGRVVQVENPSEIFFRPGDRIAFMRVIGGG